MATTREQTSNDPEVAFRTALDGRQAQIWTAMPGIVTKVNLAAMTVECQVAIQGIQTNSQGVDSPVTIKPLGDVPIVFPSAGGFTLTFPIQVGDEGLIVFASRCMDGWWLLGNVQPQLEFRMHDLSDGFFIPGPKSQPHVISNISGANAQLRSNDGTVYLEITPAGAINLVAPSGVMITGAVTYDGDFNVTGNITATGEITGNGIALSTHVHSVTTAPGTTGVPMP